jgi:hypothetical protein
VRLSVLLDLEHRPHQSLDHGFVVDEALVEPRRLLRVDVDAGLHVGLVEGEARI